MAQQDTIQVAELLARLTRLEQEALDNVARAAELSDDTHGQRRFSEGEVSALRGAQKLVRDMADWPVKEEPLVNWPAGEGRGR